MVFIALFQLTIILSVAYLKHQQSYVTGFFFSSIEHLNVLRPAILGWLYQLSDS